MANTEPHYYDLTVGAKKRTAPTMMSAHARVVGGYGDPIPAHNIAYLLEVTQPAALTGGGEGSFGFEKLRATFEAVRTGKDKRAEKRLQAKIDVGNFVVASAAHHTAALVELFGSRSSGIEVVPQAVSADEARAVWVKTIAVHPEVRASGISSALLYDALGNYPDQMPVVCEVAGPFDDNPIADWLTDKLGFELEGQHERRMWDDTFGVAFYIADSVGVVRTQLQDSGKFSRFASQIDPVATA